MVVSMSYISDYRQNKICLRCKNPRDRKHSAKNYCKKCRTEMKELGKGVKSI